MSGGMEGVSKCLGRCIETYNHHLDTLLQSMNSKGGDEETLQCEFDDICDEISKNPKDPDAIKKLKDFINNEKHNAFVKKNQLEITGVLLLLAHDINPSSKGLIKLDVIKDEDLLKILKNFIDKITLSVLKESLSKLSKTQWDNSGILYFMVQSYLEDLEKSTRTDKSTRTAAGE